MNKDESQIAKKQPLTLRRNRNLPLQLSSQKLSQDQGKTGWFAQYSVREVLVFDLRDSSFLKDFLAPFSLLEFEHIFNFAPIDLPVEKVYFNFLTFKPNERGACYKKNAQPRANSTQIDFTNNGTFGDYDLSETYLKTRSSFFPIFHDDAKENADDI